LLSQGLVLLIQKSAPLEKFVRPEYGVIYVAQEYPRWQQLTLTTLRGLYNEADNSFPPNKEVLEALKTIPEVKPYMKKLMPFVQHTKVCPAPVKPQNGLEKSCCTHLVELICLVVRICISRLVVGAARGEGTRGPGPHTSFR